jgi:predicted transcriptional regulator
MKEITELEIRRSIYNLILKNPGLHARKIAQMLKLSGQLTDYHLLLMERKNLIRSSKEEGFRRYYIEGKIGFQDRKRLAVLRREMPLRIVLFILNNPYSKHKDILRHLEVAPSTLSYHLKKLVKSGILSITVTNDEIGYTVKNREEITVLLIRYKPYSRIESLKDTWIDFTWD